MKGLFHKNREAFIFVVGLVILCSGIEWIYLEEYSYHILIGMFAIVFGVLFIIVSILSMIKILKV